MKNSRFSRVGEAITSIIDLIVVSFLWLICSLPIFTLGASSTALYYAVVKCIRHDRGDLTATFFRGFRQNFCLATLIWLLIIAYLLVIGADAFALDRLGIASSSFLHFLSRIFFLPPVFFFPWVFSYLSRFENNLKGSLKFSTWLMLRFPLRSLLLGVELVIFLLICWMEPILAPLLPAPVCLLMSISIEPVFKQFQKDVPDDGSVDTWYNE